MIHTQTRNAPPSGEWSIIALDKFISATRDSGYKGTPSAISELVDNSIQAGAKRIEISLIKTEGEENEGILIVVQDNGCGMSPTTLRQALRFGGSTRFNDRTGLGRYGMGLPNSSLSQARRVTVFTWQSTKTTYTSYLDVEEIMAGVLTEVPKPDRSQNPFKPISKNTGTVVVWNKCDRLDNRRISTMSKKLQFSLGRRFRHFLWSGVAISVNNEVVHPIDPLHIQIKGTNTTAKLFGQPLEYEVRANSENGNKETGLVTVTFSELPVKEWHGLSNKEKRALGISKGAGVSIVRGGREVDYGWFFMPGKRRENYDDWWRCEIRFDPVLDEAFGITHTKQQIRPKDFLVEVLSPDIEATARALNGRARKAHFAAKLAANPPESTHRAMVRDNLLPPIGVDLRERDRVIAEELSGVFPSVTESDPPSQVDVDYKYRIAEASLKDMAFFTYLRNESGITLVLNPAHPFYKHIYKPLAESKESRDQEFKTKLELLLFAAARSEAVEEDPTVVATLDRKRRIWSDTLATFLKE